jgi:predicted NAD/FAD-dependent oxidoreductase
MTEASVVVVGAGVAGLACARALADAGRKVTVLERARGVGGRCATRRIEGQPVDLGVSFLHGRDAGFLAELEGVPATRLPGWPSDVHGSGRPCQPEAFAPGEWRLAFAEGLTSFPKHLARGLEVRLRSRVAGLELARGSLRLRLEEGGALEARTAVLALAGEQAQALLQGVVGDAPAIASAQALLDLTRSQACLALAAAYPAEAPPPSWQVAYPEDSRLVQLVAHDSSKRPHPPILVLVIQAQPHWSRQHLDDPDWQEALLEEAGRLLGPWARRPRLVEGQRWRYARVDRAGELAAPPLLTLGGGARLGLAGERFAAGGGVEAAWLSGRRLARRILAEEET